MSRALGLWPPVPRSLCQQHRGDNSTATRGGSLRVGSRSAGRDSAALNALQEGSSSCSCSRRRMTCCAQPIESFDRFTFDEPRLPTQGEAVTRGSGGGRPGLQLEERPADVDYLAVSPMNQLLTENHAVLPTSAAPSGSVYVCTWHGLKSRLLGCCRSYKVPCRGLVSEHKHTGKYGNSGQTSP